MKFEEGRTTQWPKEKEHRSTKHTPKTIKDRVTPHV